MVLKSIFVSSSTKQITAIPPNGYNSRFYMDISLSDQQNGTQIEPKSVHGILWLQTHFESEHWESICNGLVIIPILDAKMLCQDAQKSGINVNFINSHSQINKI
tara:strand:+ start:84 stop:395 length:312 start_codon:yes stop_codon:yes gene_type:complete